ncbi:hypothetical protein ABZ342_01360 [Amycolatopsis sp. NPDC005961]|uniref:hypothetical protein n=1 Tax=Amycolatopsis sp. NPDC005961 TaxID=3156720 RepID=UPI0033D1A1CC
MKRILHVWLCLAVALGGMLLSGSVASAAPGSCATAGWVLRSADIVNHTNQAAIGKVYTYANACNQYWAQIKLDKALGAGQWANAFIDVYLHGSMAGRLTCARADGGNAPVSEGQTSCYTGYFGSTDTGITYQSHGYVYNYPSSMFASGITQNCSRWECI